MGCTSCSAPSSVAEQFKAQRAQRLFKRQQIMLKQAKRGKQQYCGRCANSPQVPAKKAQKNKPIVQRKKKLAMIRAPAAKKLARMVDPTITAVTAAAAANVCELCTIIPTNLPYPFCDFMYTPDALPSSLLSGGGSCAF
jgi:hypothetical protein